MNSMHYDIVIIGAGPAGLACAIELKNSAFSVLLIEKETEIGPKVCAGGLTGLTQGYELPLDKTRSFSKQNIILKNKAFTIDLANPIRTITRLELGQYQLQQIENAKNITVLSNTTIKEINKNQIITTDNEIIQFKYLVGADGSNSIVRKSIGLKSVHCVGLYYDIPIITKECIWYLNSNTLKTGYIWVFPHKNYTNIGVYFNPTTLNSKKAREALENYITNQGFSFTSTGIKGAPVCYNYEGHQFGNVFLVGDAAGLTSKGTGEGISFALASGKEIAKKIKNNNYKTIELNKIIRIKKRQDKLFNILETLPFLHAFLYTIFIHMMRVKSFQSYFGI